MSRRQPWPHRFAAFLVWLLGSIVIVATALPFVPTDAWWVRIMDFPRYQVAVLGGLAAALGLFVLRPRRRHRALGFIVLLLVAVGYQAAEVYRFTRLAPVELSAVGQCPAGQQVTLVIANVLMTNRKDDGFLALVRRLDPDLVLVTETDAWWDRRLAPLSARYPHAVRYPLENTYGIHLFSKLPLVSPQVRFLVQDDVPSIYTRLRLRSGRLVEFHGVHPTPPQPNRDTGPRDVELLLVGRQVAADRRPTIVAGDLNDVGWSPTTRIFQQTSGLLDPRVGRGLYATFNANWPLMQWPLDHVFVDRSFSVVQLERLEHIGSDHYPIFVRLCSR